MPRFRDRVVEIKRVRAGDLREHPRNWRRHPDGQREALEAALGEIGFAGALVARRCDDGSLELIDGHLRREVDPDFEIPVVVTDLSEEEALKLLATYDPLAELAETDGEMLREVMERSSLDSDVLRKMLEPRLPPPEVREPVEPGAPSDDSQCERGDVWTVAGHRVMCGDATNAEDVSALFDGAVPFIMITDPPYGVIYDADWRDDVREQTLGVAATTSDIENDDRVDWSDAYKLFPGDVAYVWHAGIHTTAVAVSIVASGFEIRSQIIWVKQSFTLSRGHYHWQHEPCFYAVRSGKTARWNGGRKQSTVWQIASMNPMGRVEERFAHPTQKPMECMEQPIRNHGETEDLVYDPFLGSGTTCVAAHVLGRKCYGMEISPAYCDVSLARIARQTGETPVREADGRSFDFLSQ